MHRNPTNHAHLARLLNPIAAAHERFNMVSLSRQFETAQALMAESPPIDAAVSGRFKAGISSFLNTLIDEDILSEHSRYPGALKKAHAAFSRSLEPKD